MKIPKVRAIVLDENGFRSPCLCWTAEFALNNGGAFAGSIHSAHRWELLWVLKKHIQVFVKSVHTKGALMALLPPSGTGHAELIENPSRQEKIPAPGRAQPQGPVWVGD